MRKLLLIILSSFFYFYTLAQSVGDYMMEGKNLEKEGKYKQAIAKYNQALQMAPNTAEIYFLRGRVYFNQKRYHTSIEDFDKAVNLNADQPDYYRWRGWALAHLGKHEQALQDYKQGLGKIPDNPIDFHNEMGLIFQANKQHKKAINSFDKALELDPKSPVIIDNRGDSKYGLGDLQGALEDYEKSIELDSVGNNAGVFNSIGLIKLKLKKYKEAKGYFEKAIQISPEGVYYYNRGIANIDLKNNEEACYDFNLSYKKGFKDAKEYLNASYCEGNYNPNASKYFYVEDKVNMLSDLSVRNLEKKLKAYDDSTSTQINIVIINSLNGKNLEKYSIDLAQNKGIGQEGKDNGVLILIVKNDRKMRIEVGYGLEAKLTDVTCQRIIDNIITPQFKRAEFYAGLNQAVDRIIAILSGTFSPDEITEAPIEADWSWWDFILMGFGGLVVIFILGAGHWVVGIIIALIFAITYFLEYGLYGFFAIPFFILYIGAIKYLYEEHLKVTPTTYSSSSSSYSSSSSSSYTSNSYSDSSSAYSDYSNSYSDSYSDSSSAYSDYSNSYSDSSWGGGSFGGGGASGGW